MDPRAEIREFLATRRAKITPDQAGMRLYGGRRRVPGLRREEVAMLAGVSIDYYTRLEKGNVAGVSDEVLGAVARALQLDEAERAHLFDLARAARPRRPTARQRGKQRVRASVQHILDSAATAAAFVRNGRLDLLAANAHALYTPLYAGPARPANLARFCFLDPRSHELYPDWDDVANTTVALLRTEAGRDPLNRDLSALVGELATTSAQFRTRWAAHDVQLHHAGVKRLRHPVVGMIEVAYTTMDLPAQPRLVLTFYTAQPGSPSEDALRLLASWAATIPESDHQNAGQQTPGAAGHDRSTPTQTRDAATTPPGAARTRPDEARP